MRGFTTSEHNPNDFTARESPLYVSDGGAMRTRRGWMGVAGATWLLWTAPEAASAQAWLPPRGEAAVVLGDQFLHGGDHLTLDGERLDRGRMQWNTLICDVGYGVTDRVSARV